MKRAQILLSGGNVAVPTETVYGLAALMENKQAVDRIFDLKKRPKENPLIIHIGTIDMVSTLSAYPDSFFPLLPLFGPGLWQWPFPSTH